MISDATSVLGLQQEIQRSEESRYDHRLHSVLLVRDSQFLFRRETGRFNAETFWEFLKVFREASAVPGRRVLAIRDNAPYHRSKLHLGWRDPQAPGLALDFLPPYSPDLNPIERVWKLTRRLCLHHRYFGLLDGVVAAVEGQFAEWNQTQ